jgi:streptogramin lyase
VRKHSSFNKVSEIFVRGRYFVSGLILVLPLITSFLVPTTASADSINITSYPVPIPAVAQTIRNDGPRAFTVGPDGAIWFTAPALESRSTDFIGSITTSGVVSEYILPTNHVFPNQITAGPDGALWYTMGNSIGRITTSGVVSVFPVPSGANEITTGHDGALWFISGSSIGRMTTDGSVTLYPVPSGHLPLRIVTAADGTMWFTVETAGFVDSIATDGTISEHAVPGISNYGIATDPNGRVWFSGYTNTASYIGTIAPDGAITEFTVQSFVTEMIIGPDGALWFANGLTPQGDYSLGRLTLASPPSAPANLTLTTPSPTNQSPSFSWTGVSSATFYNIYRNGSLIDTIGSSNTSYTDNTAPEGANSYYVTAKNDAGESGPSNTTSVLVDRTAPTVSMPTWSANPLVQGQSTTMSVAASDAGSGVGSVSYAVNGGTAQPMTYDSTSGTWQANFASNLTANTYSITITATDNAGNATTTGDVLAVYNVSNGYVTGHADLQPTSSDTMPIPLDTSNKPAKLVLGFTNVTSPASGSFTADYKVKNNYNEFSINSTSIDWVVVQDSTHASILGQANLTTYQNGTKTVTNNISVRMDVVLGANGAADQVTMKIYNPGVNPNTGGPAYVINDADLNGSNLMIHP